MFFIFDCNGDKIGNPNGYKTNKGAVRQCENKGSKVKSEIWKRYYESEAINKAKNNNLVYRIEWIEPFDPVKFMRENFQVIHIE